MWAYHILRDGEDPATCPLSDSSWDEDGSAWPIAFIEEHVKKYKKWKVIYRPEGIAFYGRHRIRPEDPGILWIIGVKE